jgi:hypothetical protein
LAFDLVSFVAGLAAGALVGVLAGYLHETEMIGELQERVRTAMVQFERITSATPSKTGEAPVSSDLRHELLELQDEIKKLYRRQDR